MNALNPASFANAEPADHRSSDLDGFAGVMFGAGLGVLLWVVMVVLFLVPLANIFTLGAIGAFLIGKSLADMALGE